MAVIRLQPRAFFFDFDGVIVNSESLHMQAARLMSRAQGIDFDDKYYFNVLLGFDDAGLFGRLWQDNGRELAPDLRLRLIEGKSRAFLELVRSGVVYFAGVLDFISALASRGIPLAIVSGALRAEILACLAPAGLASKFRFIVAAEDCQNSKPHPAPYQLALSQMRGLVADLKAADCWALEDSPAGIQSALGAGFQAIGIMHSVSANDLHQATAVVSGFHEMDITGLVKT